MNRYINYLKRLLSRSGEPKRLILVPDDKYLNIKRDSLPPVSVILPVYEMYGKGPGYVDESLNMLARQTWKNFEVVVSDHSLDNGILDVCKQYERRLDINYVRETMHRGSSCENANNGIRHSKYDILRFIFQDDILADEGALERAIKYFVYHNAKWMVTGCCHRRDESTETFWHHYPRFVENELFEGVNSIGCPSVLTTVKTDLFFDPRLPTLMDIDYYKRLFDKFGEPVIFNDINATIRIHPGQMTMNGASGEKQIGIELEIVRKKYGVTPGKKLQTKVPSGR